MASPVAFPVLMLKETLMTLTMFRESLYTKFRTTETQDMSMF